MPNETALIKERAGKGAYANVCPRCGVNPLGKDVVFRTRSLQIPEVCICQDCNVDELIGPNQGFLAPGKWAAIRWPEGVPP